MKTLILCTLLLIATLPIKAQQALAKYQQAMSSLANQPNGEEKSAQKGKNLAIFFDERKQEAGAETAFAETHKLLQELKATDFYAAFYVLMKVKQMSDMEIFRTTDFTSHEQEIIRYKLAPYTSNKIMSKDNPPNYPDGVPLPGYSWSNNPAKTNNPQLATTSKTPNVAIQDFEKGMAASKSNNYTVALKWFMEAAEKGLPEAAYNIGTIYYQGYGEKSNNGLALLWYRKAAEMGYQKANEMIQIIENSTQTAIAKTTNPPPATKPKTEPVLNTTSARDMYERGLKALQANALDKALRLFKEAGQKGNVLAMYQAGEVLTQQHRYDEAKLWYGKSASAGLIDGMYKTGGIEWYKKAIETGDAIVLENYQDKCYKCNGTGKIVSQTRIPGTGGAIIGQSVTQSNATTISGGTTTVTTRYSGPSYETHTYTCENCKGTGISTYKETLPSGYFKAKEALAFISGETEFEQATAQYKQSYKERDFKKAFKLYQNAAQKGHTQAMYGLGTMYRNGQGVKKDDTEALKWFKKAADAGDKSAEEAVKELSGGSPKSQ